MSYSGISSPSPVNPTGPQLRVIRDEEAPPYDADFAPPRRRTVTGEAPLLVLPRLAVAVGVNEALFLQQIHYWAGRPCGADHDGYRWVFNSYEQWHEQFPFWSVDTIGRMVRKLAKDGLIEVTQRYNASPLDQRRWYRLCYDHPALQSLETVESAKPQNGHADSQIAPAESQNASANSQIVNRKTKTTDTETTNRESGTSFDAAHENPESKPKRDPIKEPSGPIQELLAAYCRALNIDRPTNFGKALGQAKLLHQAGLTPEQVKPLIDWLFADPFWAGKGIDLGTCVSQLDKWRSSQRGNGPSVSSPGQPVSGDAEIDQLLARRHWLLTRSGVDSIDYRYDSGRAKARAEAQAIEADLTARGVTSW